ncbi:synaptogenesis protein syg-2-like isoform X2 [Centruroides vittatus]|uniref:synaptogenesis protein syg-2-like isoform X2 n=1 Tax=Centruroides vittatus TaxID=120091 RepID=UPI00350ECCDF
MNKSYSLSSLIVFVIASAGVHCLKLINFSVPAWVKKGEGVWLNCSVDSQEGLYSTKWYKNDVEVYRYVPKDTIEDQIYDASGVYIDLAVSAKGQVYLNYTNLDTEGSYRCEASGDTPYFVTVGEVKVMKIYELPESDPTIYGLLPSYDIGDEINATCVAGPSKPAAKLTWLIDDEKLSSDYEESVNVTKNEDGLEVSSSKLSFILSENFMGRDEISIKCVATISLYESVSSEELIMNDKNNTLKSPSNGTEKPIITEGQPVYRKGDLVNVNCTSPKSYPPPEIEWYINDEKASPDYIVLYPVEKTNESQSTVVGLRFNMESTHFDSKLKCTSIIFQVIDVRSDVKVVENNRKNELQMEENRGADSVRAEDVRGLANHIMPRIEVLLLLLLLPFL